MIPSSRAFRELLYRPLIVGLILALTIVAPIGLTISDVLPSMPVVSSTARVVTLPSESTEHRRDAPPSSHLSSNAAYPGRPSRFVVLASTQNRQSIRGDLQNPLCVQLVINAFVSIPSASHARLEPLNTSVTICRFRSYGLTAWPTAATPPPVHLLHVR